MDLNEIQFPLHHYLFLYFKKGMFIGGILFEAKNVEDAIYLSGRKEIPSHDRRDKYFLNEKPFKMELERWYTANELFKFEIVEMKKNN